MTAAQEARVLRRLYWWAFTVRAVIGLMAWSLSYLLDAPLIEDAGNYSMYGAALAQSWLRGEHPEWFVEFMDSGKQAWFIIALLGCFYCLTAGYEAVPLAVLAQGLLTALTPVLAYRTGRRLGLPPAGALFTGRLIAFTPAFVFWAGALYKEGVILLALFVIVDHVLRLQQHFRPTSAVILGLTMLAMFGLRFYIAAILSATIVIGLAFGRRTAHAADPVSAGMRQVLVVGLLVAVFVVFGVAEKFSNLAAGGIDESLTAINTSRQDLASNNSGYRPDADVSTVDGAIAFFPIGLAYFLTVPLPWHFGSMRQNLVILETMAWVLIIYPLAIRGAVRGARTNPSGVLFIVLTSVAICCIYAIFVGNIGTAYRMRVQVWALWALFAGWGWAAHVAARRVNKHPSNTKPHSRPKTTPTT